MEPALAESAKIADISRARKSQILQIVMMVITSAIVAFFIYKASSEFWCQDEMPLILPYTPESIVQFQGNPSEVEVGLFISDFAKFDALNNDFLFSGTVFFIFNPSIISVKEIGNFEIAKGKILSKSDPHVQILSERLLARFDVSVEFKTNLDHKLFPVGDHRISIVIDHRFLSPSEVRFIPSASRFNLAPKTYISGWDPFNFNVYSGYSIHKLETDKPQLNVYHPRVNFMIEFQKVGGREILSIILPLLLLFFIAVFSLSLDVSKAYRSIIGLTVGAVTGMLSYKYVIDRLSPDVSYFMFSDYMYFLFLILTIVIFFINLCSVSFSHRQRDLIGIALHCVVIFTFVYLLEYWLR